MTIILRKKNEKFKNEKYEKNERKKTKEKKCHKNYLKLKNISNMKT